MIRVALLVLSSLLLAACDRAVIEGAPSRDISPLTIPPGARVHVIEPSASIIDVLVYRAGPMARLGHNHVMSVHSLQGRAWRHERLNASGFELRFPVSALVVDDPQARQRAGDEFAGAIPEADRAGTRTNMLKPQVLDGAHYPDVVLRSVRLEGEWPQVVAITAITLKNVTRELPIPVQVMQQGQRLRAQGEFTLKQSDFGITPFSVAMGAVQVADELRIRFDLQLSAD